MAKASLLTAVDTYPIPLYLGKERLKILRYLNLKDFERELTPKRYKNVKLAIEEGRFHYMWIEPNGNRIEYKTIKR